MLQVGWCVEWCMGASCRLVLWSGAWVLQVGWCVEWCMGASGRLVCGVVHGCFG